MRVCAHSGGRLAAAATFLLLIVYAVLTTYRTALRESADGIAPRESENVVAYPQSIDPPLWDRRLDFAQLGFSNETANPSGCFLAPNYVHFVRFGPTPVSFVEFICALAAFHNQRPERIYFHYDNVRTFSGKYWDLLQTVPGFTRLIVFHKVELPDLIFGQPLSRGWRQWHGSDIMRIRMIMRYGGIFLDNDCYLIKSVDPYRRFEIAMNWDEGQFLGSQVIVAHKDARFLRRWLECYREYDGTKWYYNAGERPTTEVLFKEPELLHRVKVLFGADTAFAQKLYGKNWPGWRDMYVLHLLSRHQYLVKSLSEKATYPVVFSEDNIGYYPTTFREMVYDVYDKANLSWPRLRIDS